MGREPIPEDLRRFILTSVPSVPFVEALLIFRDANGSAISIDALAKRLYMAERGAAGIVEQLRAARVIEACDGGHRYAPAPEIGATLDMLANFYRTHLVQVTDIIHARSDRMAQKFADAFRLRKD